MAILSRPNISPQQRLDLEDWESLLSSLRTDSLLWTKQFLSGSNLIVKGFSITGVGLKVATVAMTDATLFIPESTTDFSYFISSPTDPDITVPDSAADGSSVGFGVVSVGDVKAAVAEASITGLLNGIPVGTAASSIKLSADKIPFISIALEALTSGKVDVYFDYYLAQ